MVAVAVIKANDKPSKKTPLQALTSAALVLPGLILSSAKAENNNTAAFQYSRYQEGKRNLFNVSSNLDPIQVDSIYGHAKLMLSDRLKFSFNYTQDTWSGATPVSTAPLAAGSNRPIRQGSSTGLITAGASPLLNTRILLDGQLRPLKRNPLTGQAADVETQPVHIMASASPETRKQGDFQLGYEWDNAELAIGGGVSLENDYQSSFGNIGGRWDFNQKLTSLNFALSYTSSDISAILDDDAAPYITKTVFKNVIENREGSQILHENREEWSTGLSITQILGKKSLLTGGLSYKHSSGYLSNPYKVVSVIFVDPDDIRSDANAVIPGKVRAVMEKRPGSRDQWRFSAGYVQYITPLDAALHFNYSFSHDDWAINAHTFEADWVQPLGNGWSIVPRIRYYSQSAADFYQPYLISKQAFSKIALDDSGREIWVDADNPNSGVEYFRDENFNLVDKDGNLVDESSLNVTNKRIAFDTNQLPAAYSSDHRLSGFGALSGGITISKQFSRGINLQLGFEYYTHAGSLKLGGSGEGSYADFNSFVANAVLNVDLSALNQGGGFPHQHIEHEGHSRHGHIPAGVMNGHMLGKAGDFMVGYRFMYARRDGNTLHGSTMADDIDIVNNACSATVQCRFTPTFMEMGRHRLNVMYAPTDWLNLMLMPQFLDTEMDLRELSGRPPPDPQIHEHSGAAGHATGGVGDTTMTALFRLFDLPGHHMHLGLGFSAPTGDVDLQFRRTFQQDGGLVHFGMQLGSGTWDFLPSLTYTGEWDKWAWGVQLRGVKRLQARNQSGYRLGDGLQASAWGSYSLTHWFSASIRGIYTAQGAIKGDFNAYNGRSGPMDFPANYGGKYWDLGLGLSAVIPSGELAGNTLSFEWLQPLANNVNGYQLERSGALTISWSYTF